MLYWYGVVTCILVHRPKSRGNPCVSDPNESESARHKYFLPFWHKYFLPFHLSALLPLKCYFPKPFCRIWVKNEDSLRTAQRRQSNTQSSKQHLFPLHNPFPFTHDLLAPRAALILMRKITVIKVISPWSKPLSLLICFRWSPHYKAENKFSLINKL